MSARTLPPATTLRGRWLVIARTAWVVIATLALGLFVASIPAYVLTFGKAAWFGTPVGVAFALDLLGVVTSITAALVCLTLASVLFWRRSNDWMVMFISSYLLAYGIVLAGPKERLEVFYPGWPTLAVDLLQPLFFTTPTIALIVLFPDGRFVPRWTRWLILFTILLTAAIFFFSLFYWWALVGGTALGAMYGQIYRYRYVSTPTERQKTKWVLFSILLGWLLIAMLSVPYGFALTLPAGSPLPWWELVGSTGWWLTLTIVPLALSIALLRYWLYDIDLLINRTLVYGLLTAMLLAVYFGGVAATQGIFRTITGHEQQPQLAIVVSTLVIAALFNPLRHRIQSFIAPLLPQEVRRQKDPRSLLGQATR